MTKGKYGSLTSDFCINPLTEQPRKNTQRSVCQHSVGQFPTLFGLCLSPLSRPYETLPRPYLDLTFDVPHLPVFARFLRLASIDSCCFPIFILILMIFKRKIHWLPALHTRYNQSKIMQGFKKLKSPANKNLESFFRAHFLCQLRFFLFLRTVEKFFSTLNFGTACP